MRAMKLALVAAAVLALTVVTTAVSFVLHIRTPVFATATPICSGPEDAPQRVLLLGDSWVAGGRLDAPLAETARVCSVSYSGLNSQDVLGSFAADHNARDIAFASLGHITDAVVVVGVNDTIQHRGASFYADGVARLAELLQALADRVFVLELPAAKLAPGVLAAPTAAASWLFSCLNDWCASDVTAPYRAAASTLPITLIDYDQMAPALDLVDLEPDGIHLTPQRSADLARLIAEAVIR